MTHHHITHTLLQTPQGDGTFEPNAPLMDTE